MSKRERGWRSRAKDAADNHGLAHYNARQGDECIAI